MTLMCVTVPTNNVLKPSLLVIVENLSQQVKILIFSDGDRRHHRVSDWIFAEPSAVGNWRKQLPLGHQIPAVTAHLWLVGLRAQVGSWSL